MLAPDSAEPLNALGTLKASEGKRAEAEQFYQALKLRKIDTALVRIPEASHTIVDRPSRQIAKMAHILKWFEMHRKN